MTTHQVDNSNKQKQSVAAKIQIAEHKETSGGYQSGILLKSYFCLSENEYSNVHFQVEIELPNRTQGENLKYQI